jgi:hypothetical protein
MLLVVPAWWPRLPCIGGGRRPQGGRPSAWPLRGHGSSRALSTNVID